MKSIKGIVKTISKKFKQDVKRNHDLRYTRRLDTLLFGVTEDVANYIRHEEGYLKKPISKLEEVIKNVNTNYYSTVKLDEIMSEFEKYVLENLDVYEAKIKSGKDAKIKEQIEKIKEKILSRISEIYTIIAEYDDIMHRRTILLEKCLGLSSDLEENRHNLASDFVDLEGAIKNCYEKKERRAKGIAIGTAAAVATAGIGAGAYVVVDHKADQIIDALVTLYGTEENIPDNIYNEFFTELGVPRSGATEKMKKIILSKTLKNIVNKDLKEITEKVSVESLELNYEKKDYQENTYRGPKGVEKDGYTIAYEINIGKGKEYIVREDTYETVLRDESRVHTVKDDEAQKVRKWLERLSIDDCMNILKGDCEKREEFEERFGESILEIKNKLLQREIVILKGNDVLEEDEIEF